MPRTRSFPTWLIAVATLVGPALHAEPGLAGHWVSPDHVTFTNPAKAGSAFFLDITVAADGRFSGTWELYVCSSFPGAYGTMTISCGRTKTPARAEGRMDPAARKGEIALEKLGKSAFVLGSATDGGTPGSLTVDLPEHWLKDKDVLLRTSRLTRK